MSSPLMLYDKPFHSTLNTFSTSSPRWLMTLTAMRPDPGLGKGRDVSLWSVAHASASISALRVVLSDLYGSLAPSTTVAEMW